MTASCLKIEMLFACYWSPQPAQHMGERWASEAGMDARDWLFKNALIDNNDDVTPRGLAWIDEILDTPFPTQKWVIERKDAR